MKVLGYLIMIAGVVVGAWLTIWWGWVGGIVALIEAAKLTPVDSYGVAISLVRILFANVVGGVVGWLLFMLGAGIASAATKRLW